MYYFWGDRHPVQLVVSLYSLREWYAGPVAIFCSCEFSLRIAELCAAESSLSPILVIYVKLCERKEEWRDEEFALLNKIKAMQVSPFSETIALDCDTLVVGKLTELWPAKDEVVLTKFGNWTVNHRKANMHLRSWRETHPELVKRAEEQDLPHTNGGVFAFGSGRRDFLERMDEIGSQNMCEYGYPDEMAENLIYLDYPHRVLDERFQASLRISRHLLPPHDKEVRIWHGHGNRFYRNDGGWKLWKAFFDAVIRRNLAQICSWYPAGEVRLSWRLSGSRRRFSHIHWRRTRRRFLKRLCKTA